jgi:hypothetical protein
MIAKSFVLFLLFISLSYAQKMNVYFYTTEPIVNDFKLLKHKFEHHLSQYGDYNFQPFSKKDDFESTILNDKNSILIMSSLHYQNCFDKFDLKAHSVGVKDNSKFTYNLIVKKKDSKKNSSVLATSFSQDYIVSMKSNKEYEFLQVPRDIDALMSVGFGIADFALVSSSAMDSLKKINKNLFNSLKIVKNINKTMRTLIVTSKNSDIKLDEFVSFINNKKYLSLIGLDSFLKLSFQDRVFLESFGR